MQTISINDPIDCTLDHSFFAISGGDFLCGEWVFRCMVELRLEDSDADLWRHAFSAQIYLHGHGQYSPDGPDVWTREAVAYVTGEAQGFDLHTAIRRFLFECVEDAFFAGYHITGSYRHDGREWNLHPVGTPEVFELPDLTT